jgi:hypothetical protein
LLISCIRFMVIVSCLRTLSRGFLLCKAWKFLRKAGSATRLFLWKLWVIPQHSAHS